ncbi:Dynein heavy chain [Durusdinium trenchii]|uniref:Cytoplasmic n=1 Tax=Durusdinium trenchii TaxID=1381693 RepID=A0ABP0HHH6_9DINO
MEKGLIPLAALDVIRGWLLLEMATPGEEDRRLIRAATRNKLGYYDIRSALLSMYEEKHHRNPFQHQRGGGKGGVFSADVDTTSWDEFEPYDPGASSSSHDQTNLYGTMEGQSWNDWDSWYDTSWYHDGWSEWSPADSPSHAEEPSSPDQANMVHHLMQEQEDAERQHMELQALTAESERTLAEARRAVTQAAKDRGWNSPPQQRQPRPTSMHPKGKGKGYGYGSNSFGPNQFGKSGKGRGKPGSPKGKFKGSSHFKGSGKGKDLHFSAHYMYPIFSAEHNPAELGPNESIVDTGATASAGGRWAVQQLCTAVINARPDATMEVYTSAELKAMMKEVVQEQMAELAASSSQGANDETLAQYHKKLAKAKAKSKGYTKFDDTRTQGPDQRDPRMQKETWPCFGDHPEVTMGNNRYGQWTECSKCGLRLKYTPATNAPAQTTKTNLPMNVTEAIARLRTQGWNADEMTAPTLKAAIEVVAKEKIFMEKKPRAKAKAKEQEEGGGRLLDDGAEAHEQHYDAAGGEACQRWLSREEAQQLKGAAQEFKIGAILASLQDFEPWVVWEICCRPQSALSDACSRMGLKACRKMLEDGYDIERDATRVRLLQDQKEEKPKRIWWSLKCTPWTSIQNLNQRNEHQIEALRKKRQKARRGVRIALATLQQMITADPEIKFYWEWPKGAYEGWRLPEMQAFEKEMAKLNVRLYWTEIHGCMFGMTAPDGECIKKEWYVMSNDYDFDYHCNVLCDHSHTHREGGMIGMGSAAVEATGYYPPEFAYMQDQVPEALNQPYLELMQRNLVKNGKKTLQKA